MNAEARPRVLVVGRGVADGRRRPFAHIVRSLPRHAQVYLADAAAVRRDEDALAAFDWHLRVNAPHLVVHVVDTDARVSTALDERLAALTDSEAAVTLAVTQPWSGDHTVPYDHGLAVGTGAPAPTAAALRRVPLAVNAAQLRLGGPHPAPACDVLLYGPPTPEALALADAVRSQGRTFRLLHPAWDELPDWRGAAFGRWPFAYRAALLGRAGLVVALPDPEPVEGSAERHADRRDQRVLEALACGAPTVALGPRQDTEAIGVEIIGCDSELSPWLADGRPALDTERLWPEVWSTVWPDLADALARVRPPARRWQVAPAHTEQPRRDGRVAFFLPAYNAEAYLETATRSALEQTDGDIEVVIVDDGSTDQTWTIACELAAADARVRAFRQENVGQIGRFDLLHQQIATTTDAPLLAFLGGDDVAAAQRVERQRHVLDDEADIDVCYSPGLTIDSDGRVTGAVWEEQSPLDRWSMRRVLFTHDPIGHPAVLQRRSTFDRFGPYNRGFAADYDYWFKTAGFARYRRLAEPLVAYRLHQQSASTGPGAERGRNELHWVRTENRADLTIADLYPELEQLGCAPPTLAHAHTHLALSLLAVDPKLGASLILGECERAEAHEPSVLARHGRALALAFSGRVDDAEAVLRPLAALGFEPAQQTLERLAVLRQGRPTSLEALAATLAFPEIADARPGAGAGVWRTDGTWRRAQCLWCRIDWQRPDLARPVIERFCRRFSRSQDVQLAFVVSHAAEVTAASATVIELTASLGALVDDAADLTVMTASERPDDAIDLPARTAHEAALACAHLERLHRRWVFGIDAPGSDAPGSDAPGLAA